MSDAPSAQNAAHAMIRTEKLTKFYANYEAVHELDLEIQPGILFGFIGPNGAGKTTTIRMLCGLLKPTSGHAFVNGVDVARHPREVKRTIGYMPETYGTYDRMRVWEYLDFFGAAYRLPRQKRRDQIEKVLQLTGTEYMRDDFVGALSKGMRQRMGIAKTLVHDPNVLFLDEPTANLDPVARIEMRELFRKLRALNKTVCISSHILPELASVCDEIAIIEKSRLLAIGPIRKILDEVRQTVEVQVQFLDRADEAARLLKDTPGVSNVKAAQNLVRFDFGGDDADAAQLLKTLVERGFPVSWMREVEMDLEQAFIKVTRAARTPAEPKGTA
jgi:ABC-2 type transport system ATP-binding protein